MPIVLNGSVGVTTDRINVDRIYDEAGTGSPSVPKGFQEIYSIPIGCIIQVTGTEAPGGFIIADGTLKSRAAFPDLWAYAQASGNLAASDAVWTKGQYSPGDGSTTFRVPNLQNQFIRGASDTRAVGNGEEDAIRNITGQFRFDAASIADDNIGAFYDLNTGATATGTAGTSNTKVGFDASRVVPTADENRPVNVAYLMCIKAYDTISDVNVLNAVGVVNDIERKLNRDEIVAPGDAPMYACRAWVNFSGTTTPIIRRQGNVSSVTQLTTGRWRITYTTAMPHVNYAVAGCAGVLAPAVTNRTFQVLEALTTSCIIGVCGAIAGSGIDSEVVAVNIFC